MAGKVAPVNYATPFPFDGAPFEHEGHIYNKSGKSACLAFRNLADSLDGFELRVSNGGVLVWDKAVPGLKMKLIKAFGFIDAPPRAVWDFLHCPQYRVVWDENRVEASRIVMVSPVGDIGYYAAKSPTGIANRDFVNQRTWHNAGNGEFVIFNTSVPHTRKPQADGFVRAQSLVTGYLIRPADGGARSSLTYMTMTDPKGWIPSIVMNYVTTSFAPTVLNRMRKAAAHYDEWAKQKVNYTRDWTVTADPWDTPQPQLTIEFAAKFDQLRAGMPLRPATEGTRADNSTKSNGVSSAEPEGAASANSPAASAIGEKDAPADADPAN